MDSSNQQSIENGLETSQNTTAQTPINKETTQISTDLQNQLKIENMELKKRLKDMETMLKHILNQKDFLEPNPRTGPEVQRVLGTVDLQEKYLVRRNQNLDSETIEELEGEVEEISEVYEATSESTRENAATTAMDQLPSPQDKIIYQVESESSEEDSEVQSREVRLPKSIKRIPSVPATIQKHFRMPSGLPKFKGSTGIKDAEEFINIFVRVCRANSLSEDTFATMLLTCLEDIDASWLECWLESSGKQSTWKEVKTEFLKHFVNANANAENLHKLRNLKMNSDVQQYADEFLTLLYKVGGNPASDTAIYQFKSGLPKWIVNQLSTAESQHLLSVGIRVFSSSN